MELDLNTVIKDLGLMPNSKGDKATLQNRIRRIILTHYGLAEWDNLPVHEQVEYIANNYGDGKINTDTIERVKLILRWTGYGFGDPLRVN